MTNNFPPPSTGLNLASVSYLAILPDVSIQPGSALDYGAGVNSQLTYTVPNLGAVFTFTTPGQFGNFDQAAFETALASSVTSVIEVLGGMSGENPATLQTEVEVRRNWLWQDADGYQLTWQDTMTYPPTA